MEKADQVRLTSLFVSFKLNLSIITVRPLARMKYRNLGGSGLRISEIGFGAWAIGGNAHGNSYGPTDDMTSIDAVQKALELGCNFFDTADVYGHGHSEEILVQALKGQRESVIIATKVGGDFYHDPPRMNFHPDYLESALAKSCERLGTDYVDLYQLHNPPIQLVKNRRVFESLEKLKESGKIRHYGISIHNPQEGVVAMREGKPAAIQVVYNILRQEAKNELFKIAQDNHVGIIAREPLANGFLSGKFKADSTFPPGDIRHNFPQDYVRSLAYASEQLRFLESKTRTLAQASLRFVLDHKEVSTTIPGAKTLQQTEENMRAADISSLTGEELLRIRILREHGFK
jgi:aryl-alcohol dehydrogenase-like predicted oxidoreductase